MDMVDTDDDSVLTNQIKDLEFLINQLPDKAGPKDKIGFKEVTYRPKGEDPDKGGEVKTNKMNSPEKLSAFLKEMANIKEFKGKPFM